MNAQYPRAEVEASDGVGLTMPENESAPHEALMSTEPPPTNPQSGFKSQQYEFDDEHNKNIAALAAAMSTVATMMTLLGLAFVVFGGLQLGAAIKVRSGFGPPIGLGVAALLFLVIGFWTSGSATSFRKIVETKNEDVWHLMNALRRLYHMYSLMRTIILGGLVLAVVGITLAAVQIFQTAVPPQ